MLGVRPKFRGMRMAWLGLFATSVSLVALPGPTVAQMRSNVGMVYADPALAPAAANSSSQRRWRGWMDERRAANPLYLQLEDGLVQYRHQWGNLPQLHVPSGPALRLGATGERVRLLRARLGLYEDGEFDEELDYALRAYQAAHGLPDDGVAGGATLASLNRGPEYYERLIEANMERARALPADLGRRYVLVDTAAAMLWMYEDGYPVDSMRVVVGKPDTQTPMMAAMIRNAVLNPYWNVPDDLVRSRIAVNVLQNGLSYLRERGYQILSGWDGTPELVDPATVDWQAVADGRQTLRVRQLPGRDNFMGAVKFMMPNDLGIYLHDTPDRHLFADASRRFSSGCIRLEDAQRLSRWLFGRQIAASSADPEQIVELPRPVPVYVTHFTAAPGERGIVFRDDGYGRDAALLARLGGGPTEFAAQE
jgi:murein L,D-transpeptidase YcbB/YkuD